MEAKIGEIQPVVVADAWLRQNLKPQESRVIEPVKKGEGGQTKKAGEEEKQSASDLPSAKISSEDVENIVQDVQEYLSELNINLDFQISDKTKDVIVKVMNAESGEMIRQIPPEDLVKLREKLVELRGVLFEGKA